MTEYDIKQRAGVSRAAARGAASDPPEEEAARWLPRESPQSHGSRDAFATLLGLCAVAVFVMPVCPAEKTIIGSDSRLQTLTEVYLPLIREAGKGGWVKGRDDCAHMFGQLLHVCCFIRFRRGEIWPPPLPYPHPSQSLHGKRGDVQKADHPVPRIHSIGFIESCKCWPSLLFLFPPFPLPWCRSVRIATGSYGGLRR